MSHANNVTPLRAVAQPKRDDRVPRELLAQLHALVREAEAGRVHSIVAVAAISYLDGAPNFLVSKFIATADDGGNLLGRLEILKTDIANWWIDRAVIVPASPDGAA